LRRIGGNWRGPLIGRVPENAEKLRRQDHVRVRECGSVYDLRDKRFTGTKIAIKQAATNRNCRSFNQIGHIGGKIARE
jgi:hypothetical protein